MADEKMRESDPLGGQAVEVRCRHRGRPVTAQMWPEIFGDDPKDVGSHQPNLARETVEPR